MPTAEVEGGAREGDADAEEDALAEGVALCEVDTLDEAAPTEALREADKLAEREREGVPLRDAALVPLLEALREPLAAVLALKDVEREAVHEADSLALRERLGAALTLGDEELRPGEMRRTRLELSVT